MLNPWVGRWNAEVAAAVRDMGSRWVMLAEGAWDHAGEAMAILGPQGNLIVRDTYQWLGGDEGVNKLLLEDPVGLAHMLAAHMLQVRRRFPAAWNVWIHDVNEAPVTTYAQRVALRRFTVTFMADIHDAGEPGIGANCGEGNPPGTASEIVAAMGDLREAVEACDKVGWHLYENTASPGKWSAFRYSLFPAWWPRDRHLPTECGFETPTGGWRGAIDEGYATGRMLEIADQWARDGLKDGGIWFAVSVQNEDHHGTYLGTPEMYRQFGESNAAELPPPPPVLEEPMPDDIYDAEFDQWQLDYAADHGLPPTKDMFHQHHTAIHGDEPVTLELVESVRTTRDAAIAQLALLKPRLPPA